VLAVLVMAGDGEMAVVAVVAAICVNFGDGDDGGRGIRMVQSTRLPCVRVCVRVWKVVKQSSACY